MPRSLNPIKNHRLHDAMRYRKLSAPELARDIGCNVGVIYCALQGRGKTSWHYAGLIAKALSGKEYRYREVDLFNIYDLKDMEVPPRPAKDQGKVSLSMSSAEIEAMGHIVYGAPEDPTPDEVTFDIPGNNDEDGEQLQRQVDEFVAAHCGGADEPPTNTGRPRYTIEERDAFEDGAAKSPRFVSVRLRLPADARVSTAPDAEYTASTTFVFAALLPEGTLVHIVHPDGGEVDLTV